MTTTLSEMWYKYRLLSEFKKGMNLKGWIGRDLYVLDAQLKLLKDLINVESMNNLSEFITRKTYMRLLKSIDKGIEYLPDLIQNPEEYVLNPIDNDKEVWISDKDVLIFTCKSGTAVFSKISRKSEGSLYVDNKFQ